MVISHNLSAMSAQRQYNIVNGKKSKSSEKLSSGYRINRAADDAAGLSISEKMRSQVRGLNRGANNTQDGISLLQVADGALAEVSDMLHRITELSVQAANDTNTVEDRQAIQQEISEIIEEIDRVSETTEFNTKKLFDGSCELTELGTGNVSYEQAKNQLLNADYFKFGDGTVDINGNTVPSDEANAYIAMLSQYVIEDNIYQNDLNYAGPNSDVTRELVNNLKKIVTANMDLVKGDKSNANYDTRVKLLNDAMSLLDTADKVAATSLYANLNGLLYMSDNGGMREYFYVDDVAPGFAAHAFANLSTLNTEAYDYTQGQTTSEAFQYGAAEINNNYGYKATINQALGVTATGSKININSQKDAVETYMKLLETASFQNANGGHGLWIQSGATNGSGMFLGIDQINATILGVDSLNVSTADGAQVSIAKSQNALGKVSEIRSKIGAQQNRLEYTYDNVLNTAENTQSAESRIRDTDMAQEMVSLSKEKILSQVGEAMIAQANQSQQYILNLLQ